MNKILLILLCFVSIQLTAQVEFITTWKTDNPGTSNSTSITIPTSGSGYNYDVDWGDGNGWETGITGSKTHDYGTGNEGIYTVKIRGVFPRIYFNFNYDNDKILSIEQWGTNPWSSMESAFSGCTNLVGNATDTPNLSNVTSMWSMFQSAISFNQDISNWDVSKVTNMTSMFAAATSFNQNIDNWNVSNVIYMPYMFYDASAFNQEIGSWNVSNVIDMSNMFNKASAFNKDIGNWNVGKVTNMTDMFKAASSFNQDIGRWNVSNVIDMAGMFSETTFNQDIGNWNVGKVTQMSYMFSRAKFNRNIGNWNVSNVTRMLFMFSYNSNFNQDIGNWNVGNVENMWGMFYEAYSFDQNIGSWNVEKVTVLLSMFHNITLSTANYDALLIGWKAQNLNYGLSFDAGNSTYCLGDIAHLLLVRLLGWGIVDGGLLCNPDDYFITTWKTDNPGTSNSTSITIPTSGSGYNYDVDWGDGNGWETGITGSKTHDYGVGNAGIYTIRIRGDFPRIYFYNTGDKDKILSIDQWGPIAWSSMANAFMGCTNLVGNATDRPNLARVSDMTSMFEGASSFNGNVSNWNVSNITNMANMFANASSFNQNIDTWNVGNVLDMSQMFLNVSLSTENYDALLNAWGAQNLQNGINFHAGNSNYCVGEMLRTTMISDFGWLITDGGKDLDCVDCTEIITEYTAAGWSNGIPTAAATAIITVDYNTSIGNISSCSLIVLNGATLTIGVGEFIEVQYSIINNGTIDVESEYDALTNSVSMGSIVQVLNYSTAINHGTINVHYKTPMMAPKTFLSVGSPMTAENRGFVFNSAYIFLGHYTENFSPHEEVVIAFPDAEIFADDNGDNWAVYDDNLNPGEGYLLFPQLHQNDGNKTYDFTFTEGTLNTGEIDFMVKFNTEKQDSPFIVANPYASAISADDFIITNADLVDEIYFWSPNTPPSPNLPGYHTMNFSMEDISMYNLTGGTAAASNPLVKPNGYITTARGFGFKAKAAGMARFTNAMRVTENNSSSVPRPSAITDRVWVSVKNTEYQMQSTTLLGFSELTTADLEQGYDSRRLATVVSLYTQLERGNSELGIQSREAFEDGAKVMMGFSTLLDANLEYSISLDDIEGANLTTATIYLIDNELNLVTNLSEGSYSFKAKKGTYDRRFTLQFKAEGTLATQKQQLSTIMLIPNPAKNIVNISNSQQLNLDRLDIYDLRGRLLQSVDLQDMGTIKSIDVSKFAPATYLIKISGREGNITKRLLKE